MSSRVVEKAVVNASPMIFLSRGGYLELLQLVAEKILVPDAVALEILAYGPKDITARALTAHPWICATEVPVLPPDILAWGLGPGESAVIALARQERAVAVLDDLQGRKCALNMGLQVRGTLGIVLSAKIQGKIAAARPVLEQLVASGLFLSPAILEQALKEVGE